MSQWDPAPVRFNLVGAVWVAGRRLRDRWSPILAIAICLVGFPGALVGAAYVGGSADLGGLVVGLVVGAGLSGLAGGATAWLALAEGGDAWAVGVDALGRAVYKLRPLAGLVLLVNIPSLALEAVWIVTHGQIMGPWAWWGVSVMLSLVLGAMMAAVAPVVGVLMIEGGDLLSALRRALAMTAGSRTKLVAIEIVRLVLLQAIWFGQLLAPPGLDGVSRAGLIALANALVAAVFSLIINQAYAQLSWRPAEAALVE